MYHEISNPEISHNNVYYQTPLYDIPSTLFEDHIKLLVGQGYKTITFEDILGIQDDGKYIILTFDDGLKGNYEYAFPILQKYDYKAVFFVTVGAIETNRFMTWSDLIDLVNQDMSVQSHGFNHKPLQTLTIEQINEELFQSKYILQKKLNISVNAISFPHGSYNNQIINLAKKNGYQFMCCSFPEKIFLSNFYKNPCLLGRIPMTNKLKSERLVKIIKYRAIEMIKLKLPKLFKNVLKKSIGIDRYRILYRKFFNIQTPN